MNEEFDPRRPLPQPVQYPNKGSERVLGGMIYCTTLADRDAIPMEWRQEGTTIAFVDNDWGPDGEPVEPEGGWGDGDGQTPRPLPPGQHYRLQNGLTNEHWVLFGGGGGGEFMYANPGTGVTVGGAPAGTVFGTFDEQGNVLTKVPGAVVLDLVFSAVFSAGAAVALSGDGVIPYGQNKYICEKGTIVEVTVSATFTVNAGSLSQRKLLLVSPDSDVLANLSSNGSAPHDPGDRMIAWQYGASALATKARGGTVTVSAANVTLTPYAKTYYGVLTAAPTPGAVPPLILTRELWGPAAKREFYVTGSAQHGDRMILLVPSDVGEVTMITDGNGFPYYNKAASPATNEFTASVINLPLLNGQMEQYQMLFKKSAAGSGTPFLYRILF